jgi:hypothetical protein
MGINHLDNEFIICLQNEEGIIPFADSDLKQLMAELAIGIYK